MDLNKNIQELLNLINPVLSKERNSTIEFPVEFTFYHVLERVKNNLESVHLLVKDSIVRHNHAIGLLSRNLLSDFITTGYIIRFSKCEEDLYSNLYLLYNSDLKKAKGFVGMYKKAGFIDEPSFLEYNNKYSDNNHIYKQINDYKIEFKLKDFPPITRIIEEFLESELTDYWALQIKRSYDVWTLFSKYEHIGWNSYDTTRNINRKEVEKHLNVILLNTTIMVASCFELLKEKNAMKCAMEMIKKMTLRNDNYYD